MSGLDDLRSIASGPPAPRAPDPARTEAELRRRSTPKAQERGLDRSTKVRDRNEPRLAKRRAECFGPCARAARLGSCAVPGCKAKPPLHPAHVRSRGAGGKDWKNVVGLCGLHHREQHDRGIATFCATYRISLEDIACQVAEVVEGHACAESVEVTRKGVRRCAICLKPEEGPNAR